jgi:hypothetical protein
MGCACVCAEGGCLVLQAQMPPITLTRKAFAEVTKSSAGTVSPDSRSEIAHLLVDHAPTQVGVNRQVQQLHLRQ